VADPQYAAPVLTGPQIQALLRSGDARVLWLQDAAVDPERPGGTRRLFHQELRALERAQEALQRAYVSLLYRPPAPAEPAPPEEGQDHGTT